MQELWAEAVLGQMVEDWLQSDVGRYALGCIEQDIETAREKLTSISPWRRKRIQQLQCEILWGERLKGYLSDAVVRGRQAKNLIDQTEE